MPTGKKIHPIAGAAGPRGSAKCPHALSGTVVINTNVPTLPLGGTAILRPGGPSSPPPTTTTSPPPPRTRSAAHSGMPARARPASGLTDFMGYDNNSTDLGHRRAGPWPARKGGALKKGLALALGAVTLGAFSIVAGTNATGSEQPSIVRLAATGAIR